MIFPYKKLTDQTYGPVVPLHLKGETRWVQFNTFVDTGADYSVFHGVVARILGLEIKTGERKIVTVGDGDHMEIYLHTLDVRFANNIFKAKIAFSSDFGAGFNLMGRASFFQRFRFCFNDRNSTLQVTKLY
ncbi:MAG: hypothetical protein HYU97_04145 [Deltaproteobacteria bacterium]|nr:hypothetical protein [Deltaproteobacteria bacterium]